MVEIVDMKKQVALITGASRGIGLAIANKFRAEGYEVLTPDRHEMDLLSDSSINNYLKKIKKPIDILINNAGINPLNELVNTKDNEIETALQVNFIAPIRIARTLVPYMIKQRYGRIVNISSIWSAFTRPKRLIYSATKSALSSATQTMAVELAQYNILVNAVAPGFVNTEMTRRNNSPSDIKKLVENVPLRRLAEPEEIAHVVAFLCSDDNTYITGQTIFVDGGFTSL